MWSNRTFLWYKTYSIISLNEQYKTLYINVFIFKKYSTKFNLVKSWNGFAFIWRSMFLIPLRPFLRSFRTVKLFARSIYLRH